MSPPSWQLVIALVCVAWAAGVLIRRGVRLLVSSRPGGETTGCSGCSSSTPAAIKQLPFVGLETLQLPPTGGQELKRKS